jgi:hypothetical protein
MKKAEKVEMKVMTTERSRFPPNITVQMLEAPPPGLHPTSQHKQDEFNVIDKLPTSVPDPHSDPDT